MAKYIFKRILMLIPVMLGVVLVVYIFSALSTDDPVTLILGGNATEEQQQAYREKYGLDDPLPVQYVNYVVGLVTRGDLGNSYTNDKPVIEDMKTRFPVTVKLALFAILVSVIIGIPLGVLSAVKQYTPTDSAVLGGSVLITSLPDFWLALMLILLFSVKLGWLPAYGIRTWKGWILPIVVASLSSLGKLVRTTRASMLEAIRQDYIRTARAKGQKARVITYKHALRNSLIPVISTIGNTIGVQLGGCIIVENVFGLPGIGTYLVTAIGNRDYPQVLGSVTILALTFTLLNLLVDLCYALVDPRVRTNFVGKKKEKDTSSHTADISGELSNG